MYPLFTNGRVNCRAWPDVRDGGEVGAMGRGKVGWGGGGASWATEHPGRLLSVTFKSVAECTQRWPSALAQEKLKIRG